MTRQIAMKFSLGFLLLASSGALAVEQPKPVIALFNDNIEVFLSGLDISENPGIEAIGVTALTTSNLAVSNPDKVKSRMKFRVRVKSSEDNSSLGSYVFQVETRSYPDPGEETGTSYYCELDNGDVVSVDPGSEGFPCGGFSLGAGIANSGNMRLFVTSLAQFAWYENQADGTVDIGKASVTVFDPASYDKVWSKSWGTTDGKWELEDNMSAVGDYLNGDGDDEVRIVYSRELANNASEMKYIYYDVATGNEIKVDKFTISSP